MNVSKKVRAKLILAFLFVAILIGVVGIVGATSLGNINKIAEAMYNINLQSINQNLSIKANMSEIDGNLLTIMNQNDKVTIDNAEKNIAARVEEDNKYMSDYEKILVTEEEKKVWEEFKNNVVKYRDARNEIIDAANSNKFDEAQKKYLELKPIEKEMMDSLDKVIRINLDAANKANENIGLRYLNSNRIILILTILGFLIAILLGIYISKNINIPLKKIKDYAERLALYDFATPIIITRKDEFGQTGTALNKAQENVRNLIREIIESSQEISASSEELSATAEELSYKSMKIDDTLSSIASDMQESSAASQQISASVQEVNASINVLSEKAAEGSNNANKSKDKAKKVQINSRKAIDETKELYTERESKMLEVIENGKVVNNIKIMADTIGSIAEQTNLLALNAAIEAARAGEQGRGFAVVAEEVRKLAEESSQAVTAIQDTINKVQEAFNNSINTGNDILRFIDNEVNKQFNDYGDTGEQYYSDSDLVSKMSEEIAAMSEEITATVGQVSDVVQTMAESAQKSNEEVDTIKESMDDNTKAIEQVAKTAQNQAERAQRLNEMVHKFLI